MLPKSRILSALLVGLGITLIVAGLIAPRMLNADGRLPLDLEQTTWTLRDDAATTRLLADGRQLETPVTRQLHLEIQEPATEDTATVRIGTSLLRESQQEDSDRLITAATWAYELDRHTGEATTPATLTHTIGMPPVEVPVDGVWLKFPSDAQQTTYDVFDPVLREARPATFVEETEIAGRTVYQYRQVIEPTNVARLYAGVFTTADLDGERGMLHHSATTDYYVDQVTGLVVDVETRIDDFYAPAGAEDDPAAREPFLRFDGARDDAQVEALADELNDRPDPDTVNLVRWIVVAVGLIVLAIALAGAFLTGGRNGRRRKNPAVSGNGRAAPRDSAGATPATRVAGR